MITLTVDAFAYRIAAHALDNRDDDGIIVDDQVDDIVVHGLYQDLIDAAAAENVALFSIRGIAAPLADIDVSVRIGVGHSDDGDYDGLYAELRANWPGNPHGITARTGHTFLHINDVGGTNPSLTVRDRLLNYLHLTVDDLNHTLTHTQRSWTELLDTPEAS